MTQALAQCEHTLSKLEGCAREAVDDTAGAAQVYKPLNSSRFYFISKNSA
jgi:prephenate dehydratase